MMLDDVKDRLGNRSVFYDICENTLLKYKKNPSGCSTGFRCSLGLVIIVIEKV